MRSEFRKVRQVTQVMSAPVVSLLPRTNAQSLLQIALLWCDNRNDRHLRLAAMYGAAATLLSCNLKCSEFSGTLEFVGAILP